MKIFLINLDRSPDRLQYMQKQFEDFNLQFERIPAVDGKNLDMNRLEEFADRSRVEEWKDLLTPNAIACSLSHYAAYKRMVEEDIEIALVIEDDIELGANFPEIIKNIDKNELNDSDVFLIYFHGDKKVFSNTRKIEITSAYSFYPVKSVWGAYAAGGYIIRKKVAQKLADHVFPIKFTADCWGPFYRDGIIGGLWALLPLVTKPANFSSDIGYTKASRIIRFVEKVPFLPFHSILNFIKTKFNKNPVSYEIVPDAPEWD